MRYSRNYARPPFCTLTRSGATPIWPLEYWVPRPKPNGALSVRCLTQLPCASSFSSLHPLPAASGRRSSSTRRSGTAKPDANVFPLLLHAVIATTWLVFYGPEEYPRSGFALSASRIIAYSYQSIYAQLCYRVIRAHIHRPTGATPMNHDKNHHCVHEHTLPRIVEPLSQASSPPHRKKSLLMRVAEATQNPLTP